MRSTQRVFHMKGVGGMIIREMNPCTIVQIRLLAHLGYIVDVCKKAEIDLLVQEMIHKYECFQILSDRTTRIEA